MKNEKFTYLEKVFEIRKMSGERPWCCVVLGWYYEDNIKTKSEAIKKAEDYIEQNYHKIDQEDDDEWPKEWT